MGYSWKDAQVECFSSLYFNKETKNYLKVGQSESTVGRTFALQTADIGFFPVILYGALSTTGMSPLQSASSNLLVPFLCPQNKHKVLGYLCKWYIVNYKITRLTKITNSKSSFLPVIISNLIYLLIKYLRQETRLKDSIASYRIELYTVECVFCVKWFPSLLELLQMF